MADKMTEQFNLAKTSLKDILKSFSALEGSLDGVFSMFREINSQMEKAQKTSKETGRRIRSDFESYSYSIRGINEYLKKTRKEQEEFLRKIDAPGNGRQSKRGKTLYGGMGLLNGNRSEARIFSSIKDYQKNIDDNQKSMEFINEILEHSEALTAEQKKYFQGIKDNLSDEMDALVNNQGVPKRILDAYRKHTNDVSDWQDQIRKIDEILNSSTSLSNEDRELLSKRKEHYLELLDGYKDADGISMRLISQLDRNRSSFQKLTDERKNVSDLLQKISDGTVKATEKDVKDLTERKNRLDATLKKDENAMSRSAFLSSNIANPIINGLVGRIGSISGMNIDLSNTTNWLTDDRKEMARKNREADINSRIAIGEQEAKRKDLSRRLSEGKISKDTFKEQSKAIDGNIAAIKSSTKAIKGGNVTAFVKAGWAKILADIAKMTIGFFRDINDRAKKMLDEVSSYAVSSSLIVNSQARNQMLRYGLSESQNYAYSKTAQLMGISGEEDLYWMNDNQRMLFQELMQKESAMYDEMTSNGTLAGFQEMKIDLQVMKDEFASKVVKFLVDNKDIIETFFQVGIKGLEVLMNITKGIFDAVSWIGKKLGFDSMNYDKYEATRYDVSASELSSYAQTASSVDRSSGMVWNPSTTNSRSVTYNINMNNNLEGTDQEMADKIGNSVKKSIMTYSQS